MVQRERDQNETARQELKMQEEANRQKERQREFVRKAKEEEEAMFSKKFNDHLADLRKSAKDSEMKQIKLAEEAVKEQEAKHKELITEEQRRIAEVMQRANDHRKLEKQKLDQLDSKLAILLEPPERTSHRPILVELYPKIVGTILFLATIVYANSTVVPFLQGKTLSVFLTGSMTLVLFSLWTYVRTGDGMWQSSFDRTASSSFTGKFREGAALSIAMAQFCMHFAIGVSTWALHVMTNLACGRRGMQPPCTSLPFPLHELLQPAIKSANERDIPKDEEDQARSEEKLARHREKIERRLEQIDLQEKDELAEIQETFKRESDQLVENTWDILGQFCENALQIASELNQQAVNSIRPGLYPLPVNWEGNWLNPVSDHKYRLFRLNDTLFQSLMPVFDVDYPKDLGIGHDVKDPAWRAPGLKELKLAGAWRIENPSLFNSYCAAVESVRQDIRTLERTRVKIPSLRTSLDEKLTEFCHKAREELRPELNETFLLHGTKPDALTTIFANGLNERFCRGLLGNCVYLAEDTAKNDQYTEADRKISTVPTSPDDSIPELHKMLYSSTPHPQDVYYVVVCRVVMGYFATTFNGSSNAETNAGLWAIYQRELAGIPRTNPKIHHHALLAQSARYLRVARQPTARAAILLERHREFCLYNAQRIYPAYLLAYQRILYTGSGKQRI